MRHAAEVLRDAIPDVVVPNLVVLLVLGDPGDGHFMEVNLGMSANGSVPGYV